MQVSLTELFDKQDQTVPQSENSGQRLPSFKKLTFSRQITSVDDAEVPVRDISQGSDITASDDSEVEAPSARGHSAGCNDMPSLIESFAGRDSKERAIKAVSAPVTSNGLQYLSKDKQQLRKKLGGDKQHLPEHDGDQDNRDIAHFDSILNGTVRPVEDFNRRIAEQQPDSVETTTLEEHPLCEEPSLAENKKLEHSLGVVQNAFDRVRPRRSQPEVASITIGSKTTTSILSPSSSKRRKLDLTPSTPPGPAGFADDAAKQRFSGSMRAFAAPGSDLFKSVGRLRSKSRVSRVYFSSASDDEDGPRVSDLSPEASSPSEDNGGSVAECSARRAENFPEMSLTDVISDDDYLDVEDKKAQEEGRVAEMIRQAEDTTAMSTHDDVRCADQILKGHGQKDSTMHLMQMIDESARRIDQKLQTLETLLQASATCSFSQYPTPTEDTSAEESLSLIVSKADFANMHITGQFNLGFVLAVRAPPSDSLKSDLFIIDQHASDEKYNFERLQANTIVQNQRLVHPHRLDLTAIEEEIVLDNSEALLKNGFQVEVDTSGNEEVGRRCQLVSLPMSREVTFDVTDLKELISLLAETPSSSSSNNVPRPTKVRRMFAMRACRSSVMIGKTLTLKQMGALVGRMGEIDKPWNCPHGRPTMRHLCGLQDWEGWKESDGLAGMEEARGNVEWGTWMEARSDGARRNRRG